MSAIFPDSGKAGVISASTAPPPNVNSLFDLIDFMFSSRSGSVRDSSAILSRKPRSPEIKLSRVIPCALAALFAASGKASHSAPASTFKRGTIIGFPALSLLGISPPKDGFSNNKSSFKSWLSVAGVVILWIRNKSSTFPCSSEILFLTREREPVNTLA